MNATVYNTSPTLNGGRIGNGRYIHVLRTKKVKEKERRRERMTGRRKQYEARILEQRKYTHTVPSSQILVHPQPI